MVETPDAGSVGGSISSDDASKAAAEAQAKADEEARQRQIEAKALVWRAETQKDVVAKKKALAEELAETKEVQAKAVYADTLRRAKEAENEANWLIAKAGGVLT